MTWLPLGGSGGADLSDVDPQPVDDIAAPGVSADGSRADHVHTLGSLDSLTLVSPDGTTWQVTITDLGALTTTALNVLLTEAGDLLTTEAGALLLLES